MRYLSLLSADNTPMIYHLPVAIDLIKETLQILHICTDELLNTCSYSIIGRHNNFITIKLCHVYSILSGSEHSPLCRILVQITINRRLRIGRDGHLDQSENTSIREYCLSIYYHSTKTITLWWKYQHNVTVPVQ